VNLSTEQVEYFKKGESFNLLRNEEGNLVKDIKTPLLSIEAGINIKFVDVTLENDPDVNLFGTSNIYFSPSFSNKNKFYIIKDGIKQGLNSENILQDDKNTNDLFMISKIGNHIYLTNESNTSILFLDENENEIKSKDLSLLSQAELYSYRILINFREKNINNN
jgi:hypothetical protein